MMLGLKKTLIPFSLCALMQPYTAHADFLNGGFENTFNPQEAGPSIPITDWTSKGYLFKGYKKNIVLPPKSLEDILLDESPSAPKGITDIVKDTITQSLFDYFLKGATPQTTIKLPVVGNQTASINLRAYNPTPPTATNSVSGASSKPKNWTTYKQQATSLSQTITISSADIISGMVHIRFKMAPVVENPSHTPKEQPFYAIQVNN